MNVKAVFIAILVSSACIVDGKQHLRASSTTKENKELTKDSTRNLQYSGGACSFAGEMREPGQWFEGPTQTCMCDRYGSGAWVGCDNNGYEASTSSGPSLATAFGRRQGFQPQDFVFDLLGSRPESITPGGTIQPVTAAQLPSLAGEGVSYTLFNVEPCGINLPHSHPRATELIYVIGGRALRTAFVEENGGRVIVNDIGKGEVTFFPEGLIHYQQNFSCEPAIYLSALNSEDPGVVTIATQFFRLPQGAQVASLGEPPSTVNVLISGLPDGPAVGRQQCLQKCGL